MAERRYWLNLFSATTWNEFLQAGANATGFSKSRWNTVQQIKPGDYLLCYVTGISRFIGVLETKSEAYRDQSPIWQDATFPARIRVELLVQLDFDTAVPIHHLRDELSIFRGLDNPHAWTGHVRGSPTQWSNADGEAVVAALREAREHPTRLPVDQKKLKYRPRALDSQLGAVTVPEDENGRVEADTDVSSDSSGSELAHTEIQWLLLKLGSDMGLDVWAARNDRSRAYQGRAFSELPRFRTSLPRQFDPVTTRIIEHIDVLWLAGNAIEAAFEIESTTSIYSGLLRMSDLIAMQPNLNIRLFIVAPDERRSKVIEEVNRPTFSRLQPALRDLCRFMSFGDLRLHIEQSQSYVRHLKPDVLTEFSEPCDPEIA